MRKFCFQAQSIKHVFQDFDEHDGAIKTSHY